MEKMETQELMEKLVDQEIQDQKDRKVRKEIPVQPVHPGLQQEVGEMIREIPQRSRVSLYLGKETLFTI